MMPATVKLVVPFDSLVNSVKELSFEEKYHLWKLLEEQIGQFEEELLEKDDMVWDKTGAGSIPLREL